MMDKDIKPPISAEDETFCMVLSPKQEWSKTSNLMALGVIAHSSITVLNSRTEWKFVPENVESCSYSI